MASIQQAAKGMIEGKSVKCRSWGDCPAELSANSPFEAIHYDFEFLAAFSPVGLMAEDWEIAE